MLGEQKRITKLLFLRKKHIAKLTDEAIVELYQDKRNNKYIGVLYERYYHLVFGVCLKYLKSTEDSEDAVVLIFEKLIEDLKTAKVLKFSGWLYMVSKNYCLQQLRKKKFISVDYKELEEVLVIEDHLLTDKLNEEMLFELLEQKIEILKIEHQQCIRLFYLNKKSYTEIEALTGYGLKSVKSHIQNGKRKLKILLENEYNQLIKQK